MGLTRAAGLLVLVSLAGTLVGCQSSAPKVDRFAVINGERVAAPEIKMGDARTIEAIISEGTENSQVFAILTEMCTTFGPRLTGSAAGEKAQNWSRDKFASWGLSNAKLAEWGTIATRFDRGSSTGAVYLPGETDATKLRDLEFSTLAWTKGTDGPVRGGVVHMPATIEEYEANAGKYANAWILLKPDYSGRRGIRSVGYLMREHLDLRENTRLQLEGKPVKAREERRPRGEQADAGEANTPLPEGQKWTGSLNYNGSPIAVDLVLTKLGESPEGVISVRNFHTGPIQDARLEGDTLKFRYAHSMGVSEIDLKINGDKASGTSTGASGTPLPLEFTLAGEPEPSDVPQFEDPVLAKVLAENPAGFVSSSKDERVWTTSANGWRERELPDYARDIEVNVRESDYDYITARLAQGVDIQLEFNLPHTLQAGPIPVYNVIAEIPGTEFPDEVIIISGHQDSWDGPGSQGTVDNGTGTSVTMEAARILMAAGAKPKRTIRFCLWSGEEQGLLGSRAYVRSLTEEEAAKISAAFVDDGGTNYQGGIPAADFMVDYLAAATSWTNGRFYSDIDAKDLTVNIRPTGAEIDTHGGSDHAAFIRAGIPGFFWDEEGRADYGYGWHTQNDRLDQAIEEYLVQSAVNTAITAFNLANAPALLPRTGPVNEKPAEAPAAEPTASATR